MQKFVGLLGNTRRFTVAIITVLTVSCVQETMTAPFDLTMVRSRTATTLSVEQRFFPEHDCAVLEGCVRAPGLRTLLRFDVSVANVGRDFRDKPMKDIVIQQVIISRGSY